MKQEISGCLGKYISILNRFQYIYFDKVLEKYGIGGGQQFVLLLIWYYQGISQLELAKKMQMDKGTIAKAVKKLVIAGYVVQKKSKQDKRLHQIYTTEAAKPVIQDTMSAREVWRGVLNQTLTQEEMEQTEQILRVMARNALDFIRTETQKK